MWVQCTIKEITLPKGTFLPFLAVNYVSHGNIFTVLKSSRSNIDKNTILDPYCNSHQSFSFFAGEGEQNYLLNYENAKYWS